MNVEIPNLTRFDGGPSVDGDAVCVLATTDLGDPIQFAIELEKVSWVIAKLAEWTRDAAKITKWKSQPIDGQDDTGLWIRPTQFGLVEVESSNSVNLVFDVGPIRFRFALRRSHALEIGRALAAAAANKDRKN